MKDKDRPGMISMLATAFLLLSALIAGADDKKKEVDLKLSFGGRTYSDWSWFSFDDNISSEFGSLESGNEWRAIWLNVTGEFTGGIEFKIQFDFANGDATAKDIYLGIKDLPVGKVRIGHFKEPFSLEQLTANKFTTFMERSLADVFVPGRNTGIAVFNKTEDERITWGFGVFTDADSYGQAKTYNNAYNLTGRITGLPWAESAARFVHLGFAVQHRSVKEEKGLRFRQRPESHLSFRLVDTGSFQADAATTFGLEFAVVAGQFSLQSEYIRTNVNSPDYGDPNFNSYYLFASYFLTNDHRGYSKKAGAFSRVKPSSPFRRGSGKGAWELALRYSKLNLNSGMHRGGILDDITVGLNWYLNKNTRIMWNYIRANLEDVGKANIGQMRFQFDF